MGKMEEDEAEGLLTGLQYNESAQLPGKGSTSRLRGGCLSAWGVGCSVLSHRPFVWVCIRADRLAVLVSSKI